MGGDMPAEIKAAAVGERPGRGVGGRSDAQSLLADDHRTPWAQRVVDGILVKLSSAMSALDVVNSESTARRREDRA